MDILFKCPLCVATIRKDEMDVDMKRVYCHKCDKAFYHPFFEKIYKLGMIHGEKERIDKVQKALGIIK